MSERPGGLSAQDQRFIRDARRSHQFQWLWIITGACFGIFGIYLTLCREQVFSHADRLLAKGKISIILQESREHTPKTDLERFQQVLIDEAYYGYLPPLFSALGACAFGFGTFLVIHIRTQAQWLKIIGKLNVPSSPDNV